MKHIAAIVISFLLLQASFLFAENTIDLSGQWRIALDREDAGQKQEWFKTSLPGDDTIHLPGSIQRQGYGDMPGPDTPWTGAIVYSEWDKPQYAPYRKADNFKIPFWLQPEKYYKGVTWFQKKVTIPPSWENKHITLMLERPHWETKVWVDSAALGVKNYLSIAHTYDLSEFLSPGDHVLTICVDNRMIVDVGENAHSVSDHTQSNWNGIVGRIELKAEAPVWIEDMQVYPDLAQNAVKVVTQLGSRQNKQQSGQLVFDIYYNERRVGSSKTNISVEQAGASNEIEISLKGPLKTWDEFNPNLYTLKAHLNMGTNVDEYTTTFGMRQIEVDGNHFMLNGHRIFFRGTLECSIFPKTGYPPTDVQEWKRIIKICKAHGLNHIRFHSWCPPEAAFQAADEMGFYYQVECAAWAAIGGGRPIDKWLYDEADAIQRAYGNHPSFLLFAYGNEPGWNHVEYLKKWVSHYKQIDSRRLVTGGSGWPELAENEFFVTYGPRIQVEPEMRINNTSPETMTDYSSFIERYPNQPIISHEIGQYCVYPNFDEMKKYTGVLKAKNFEVFRDFLENKHMLDQAHDFLMASGKLQTLCYKEEIESALRTPDFGGFQLLDLHDFPGQGTALVGVLDPFWDSKPYVSPTEYKRFCDAIVPLARLPKRIFTSSDTLSAQVDVSQFGPTDLSNVKIKWSLLDTVGNAVKEGVLSKDKLPSGDLYTIGNINFTLSGLPTPAKYTLKVAIDKTDSHNDWDVWVYPDTVETEAAEGIMISNDLDQSTLDHLQKGGKVLLALKPSKVITDVKLGFSSIFWNTAWSNGRPPHTLGILCDPKHPALAAFPTDYYSNWQWSEPIQNAAVMEMDHLPKELRPIVQVVPNWFDPKRLGLVFEAKVGNGSLVVSSVDITGDLENRPVVRQLRHSLLTYMDSGEFNPTIAVDVASIKEIYWTPTLTKLGAKVIRVDSFDNGYEGQKAIDNNFDTIWHTEWMKSKPKHPHDIQIDLGKPVDINGIMYMPRQDGLQYGWVREYAVYVSDTPDTWGDPIARGEFKRDVSLKKVLFEKEVSARYIRFEAVSGFNNDVFTSAAELDLILKSE